MYLYFNKHGTLTTIIPHGEPVRQGSYLNIYVLLDEDFFYSIDGNINDYNITVELVFPDNPSISTDKITSTGGPNLLPFSKTDDSEMTYDLVQGVRYWTYHFRFTPNQATMNAGKINACVSIQKINMLDYGDVESTIEEDLIYFGKADIYVEKTFGAAKKIVNESSLHYKNLVMQINNINNNKVSKTGDNLISINDSYFVKDENLNNYRTLQETNGAVGQVLKGNKYQLVELTKNNVTYTYHLINGEDEIFRTKYYFIRYVDFRTISVLVFNDLDKKWYLYEDAVFLTHKDIDDWIPINTKKGIITNQDYIEKTKKTFNGFVYDNGDKEKIYFRFNSYKQTDDIIKRYYTSEEISEDGKSSIKKVLIFNEGDNSFEITSLIPGSSYRIVLDDDVTEGKLSKDDLEYINSGDVVFVKNKELFNLSANEKTENINEYSFVQLNSEKSINVNLETGEWVFHEDSMLSLNEDEILSLLN